MVDSKTERDVGARCRFNLQVVPGHTHWCRLTNGHHTEHECICEIRWSRVQQESE